MLSEAACFLLTETPDRDTTDSDLKKNTAKMTDDSKVKRKSTNVSTRYFSRMADEIYHGRGLRELTAAWRSHSFPQLCEILSTGKAWPSPGRTPLLRVRAATNK